MPFSSWVKTAAGTAMAAIAPAPGVTVKTGTKTAVLDPNRRNDQAKEFETALRRKVVGQDAAIEKAVEIYQMFLAGLNPPGRPVGNLLFLGPTGTGKTRVVEAMAEALFGDARACIKIDCAEFQHSHEIAKLIGSPPGYLGHRETHPLLTQEALNQWHREDLKLSILLFDEIEKSSDALWQLLLGILDKATLTLGDNRRVDLSSCIIILTSNLGGGEMVNLQEGGGLGFQGKQIVIDEKFDERIERTALEAAKRKFTPEFMNRIDKTVVFKTLRDEHLKNILDIELQAVQARIWFAATSNQFIIHPTDNVKAALLLEGTDPKYGARHLKRAIERNVVHPLANLVATNQVKMGDVIQIDYEGEYPKRGDSPAPGKYVFSKIGENVNVPNTLERVGAMGTAAQGMAAPQSNRISPIAVKKFP
jgi:ATP-dependent Clp protease ATP-binding subunit ClpB